jgi:hypothetical protein
MFVGALWGLMVIAMEEMTIVPGPGAELGRTIAQIIFAALACLSFWLAKRRTAK